MVAGGGWWWLVVVGGLAPIPTCEIKPLTLDRVASNSRLVDISLAVFVLGRLA